MKVEFETEHSFGRINRASPVSYQATGECHPLRRVLLCAPHHLEPVPCCSVTKESIRTGFRSDAARALDQHRALRSILTDAGVAVELLPARSGTRGCRRA